MIEVLAAAVPVDAIFVGKLFAMLAVSLVGIAIWAAGAVIGGDDLVVGQPACRSRRSAGRSSCSSSLSIIAANYLLLGAIFLGIGSQAASMREVQTLSMPVTVGQLILLMLAIFVGGQLNGIPGIAAAIFPFSSPLMMVSRAAQIAELWPHLVAIAWQAFWVWLTVSLAASLFRRNVMKSGSGTDSRRRGRKAAAKA